MVPSWPKVEFLPLPFGTNVRGSRFSHEPHVAAEPLPIPIESHDGIAFTVHGLSWVADPKIACRNGLSAAKSYKINGAKKAALPSLEASKLNSLAVL